ncbi:hypothetical protein L2E82_20058 [Cichorium intybus]|uniref:Uncharacterized protein n=1 Tax=Cichorium intybus TaxID=13427 RepID=A0ACB9DSL2_CICIN|nr:hypothetical protein L2E82_20058 [Cichorium intybus]
MLVVELAERHIAGIEQQAIIGCMIPASQLIQQAVSPLQDCCSHPQCVLIADDGPLSLRKDHFVNTYEGMVETY